MPVLLMFIAHSFIDNRYISMANRVRPMGMEQGDLSDISRHQLQSADPIFHPDQPPTTLSHFKLKFLMKTLAKRIKHLAPPNKTPPEIEEEWQSLNEGEEGEKEQQIGGQTLSEEMSWRWGWFKGCQVLEGILVVLFCWVASVSIIFGVTILVEVPILVAAFAIVKLTVKVVMAYRDRQEEKAYKIDWWLDFVQPSLFLLAVILMVVRYFIGVGDRQIWVGVFEWLVIFGMWQKLGGYFEWIAYLAEQHRLSRELRIFQLFCFILMMAHLFGLVMYSMVYVCPQGKQTWLQKAGLEGQPWYILYIYSVYWANTTMVTVGYGDFSPNNYIQALIVTGIQVVGTAIFGYMINVVGITVKQIQNTNLEFQARQSTINKLKQHYKLSRQLCSKFKKDIGKKKSQLKATPLQSNEQHQFLQYIEPPLKSDFVLETNMRVIKKSLFFLTHFTIQAQNQLALSLIRRIYQPNESIPICTPQGRQLLIINSGLVTIAAIKQHHGQEMEKIVRTIKPEEGKPTLNVFGFSALILNRDIPLKAQAQEAAAVYLLPSGELLRSIGKHPLDFESIHEIREKMLLARNISGLQAPLLIDESMHFAPNIYILHKKIRHQRQERTRYRRRPHRCPLNLITMRHYKNKTMLYIPEPPPVEADADILQELNQQQIQLQRREAMAADVSSEEELIMDQVRQFERFLKKSNLNAIAEKYEKACERRSYNRRLQDKTAIFRNRGRATRMVQ